MSYYDTNYLLQEAIDAYLQTNLATYASGVAGSLPRVLGGDFGDRSRDHVYITSPEMDDDPDAPGSFLAQVIAGVGTLAETPLATHRAYAGAVIDLMRDSDLPAYINAAAVNKVRVNELFGPAKVSIGVISDGMRFTEVALTVRVYQVP